MSKNIVQPDRPQMTVTRMRIAYWITTATNTYSENVTLMAFPLQQWLPERASILRHMYIACLVYFGLKKKLNREITAECNDVIKQVWIRFHCYWNTELTLDACGRAGLQNFLRMKHKLRRIKVLSL
jgi:hypothetical protein